jgi:hypothetical protein
VPIVADLSSLKQIGSKETATNLFVLNVYSVLTLTTKIQQFYIGINIKFRSLNLRLSYSSVPSYIEKKLV